MAYTSPDAYVARYGESDKEASGLGAGPEAWPVPYWYGDAAMGVMAVLLAAVDAGLGACILGAFRGAEDAGGAARGARAVATLLRRGARAARRPPITGPPRSIDPRPPRAERLHRGRW